MRLDFARSMPASGGSSGDRNEKDSTFFHCIVWYISGFRFGRLRSVRLWDGSPRTTPHKGRL